MGYTPDLTRRSLDWFREHLQEEHLLPSQRILLDKIDERFAILVSSGIPNMENLRQALKTKKDLALLSSHTGIPEDYLALLRRVVNSFHPKKRMIRDFPGIEKETIQNLERIGVHTTSELYGLVTTMKKREKLCRETGVKTDEIVLLAKMTDLTRMRYVNPAFASLLVQSGYDRIETIRTTDAASLCRQVMTVNDEKGIYRGVIGEKDMAFLIRESGIIPLELEL